MSGAQSIPLPVGVRLLGRVLLLNTVPTKLQSMRFLERKMGPLPMSSVP